ncbi:hypothetical protein WJX82_006907 [Trebouxia sp. C0006]
MVQRDAEDCFQVKVQRHRNQDGRPEQTPHMFTWRHCVQSAGGASDALHDTSGAGFLGVLAIHIGSIAVVIYNVARSKMAVTSYCIQALTPLALVAFLLLLKRRAQVFYGKCQQWYQQQPPACHAAGGRMQHLPHLQL